MKIKNMVVAACMVMSMPVVAQNEMDASAVEARKVLDEMADEAKSHKTIAMNFAATYENKRTGATHTSEGTLKVKGEKYVLDIEDMVTYSDEEGVSVWQKKVNELTISEHDAEAEGDMSPARLFGGAYQEGYKLRLLGEVTVGGEKCMEVDLYPKDMKSQVVRVRLTISKKGKQLKRFMQQYKLGEVLTVDVRKYVTDKSMSDSEFVFDRVAHKGVEVVDLR